MSKLEQGSRKMAKRFYDHKIRALVYSDNTGGGSLKWAYAHCGDIYAYGSRLTVSVEESSRVELGIADESTITAYTGFCDRFGCDVYEGDIIKVPPLQKIREWLNRDEDDETPRDMWLRIRPCDTVEAVVKFHDWGGWCVEYSEGEDLPLHEVWLEFPDVVKVGDVFTRYREPVIS